MLPIYKVVPMFAFFFPYTLARLVTIKDNAYTCKQNVNKHWKSGFWKLYHLKWLPEQVVVVIETAQKPEDGSKKKLNVK